VDDHERFIFPYQKRQVAEEVFVHTVCKNFVQHYKKHGLHQDWSIITIIGGSGTGKSRFSYETWSILLDFIQNKPEKCLEYLDKDEDVFSQFKEFMSPDSIIEVFIKETNGNQIKKDETVEYHLKCCLGSCLVKTSPTTREYIAIGEWTKKLKDYEGKLDISSILETIRLKMNFSTDKPLTILWRVDEVQQIDPTMNVHDILKEEDAKKRENSRHSTVLYQYVTALMSLTTEREGTATFIVPIFSGTSDERLKSVMPSSSYVIASIPLYISDISLETALLLMKSEVDEEIISRIQHLDLFLYSLGPIPRLIQFSVEYLKKSPNSSLKELYNYMQDQVKSLYKLFGLANKVDMLLIEMIDQWRFDEMRGEVLQFNNILIESGQIFKTKEGTLMMPLIFVELLFNHYSSEWEPLKNYISRGIKGEIHPVDLELFPCYFYAFKIHLYQNLGITSMTMREFFRGAYMHQKAFAHILVFTHPMSVFESSKSQVNDITQVDVRTMPDLLDMSKRNVALHIGKHNIYYDFLMSLSECSTLIRGESKFSGSGGTVVFSGPKTENSFAAEQQKALNSPCELNRNYFLFITNAKMAEIDAKSVVMEESMFINRERWVEAFSPIFAFLKDQSSKNKN
jgi:hypothetical protein